MQRLMRAAEIARAKTLNGTSPISRARPVSLRKSRPPSAKSTLVERPGGLADHRLDPVAAELVAVAVEEDVHLLLDRLRREELRVGAPEERLGPPGAELAEPLEAALGVREQQVVLGRVGLVVPVEAGVHAAELRQAHRDVAVVERDRDAVPLAEIRRDAAQVRHRHREDDDRVWTLTLDELVEVPLPARCHPAPDELARHAVAEPVLRVVLGPPQQCCRP